jgi:L-seryl-tRNA(Ser) seleniumtransferase
LAKEALEAVAKTASGYSDLEYNLSIGERGGRLDRINELTSELTGAQASYVVNNNAAAVFLTLAALAQGKEVIVSRGELVEIGGGFRIPEVLEQSGAKLIEVGTTNKTRIEDYEKAINENTCALLKVHKSNYRIVGFTLEVDTEELVELSRKYSLLTIEDLGSGMLIKGFGEPTVQEVIASGVDIVTFSGDKLLGGPQAGIIAGKSHIVAKIRSHPLARALRIDKMTLAALEITLKLYMQSDTIDHIPVIRMLNMSREELFKVSSEFCEKIKNIAGINTSVVEVSSQAGGGSLPGYEFPGYAVTIKPSCGCTSFVKALREAEIPVISRIAQDSVIIDLRTVLADDYEDLLKSLIKTAEELL